MGNSLAVKMVYHKIPADMKTMEKCPFVFSCKSLSVISDPAVTLSKDFADIRPRIEELVSKFSVRDLVEEFIYLGIRPLSANWTLPLGEIPEGSSSLLPPFEISANSKCLPCICIFYFKRYIYIYIYIVISFFSSFFSSLFFFFLQQKL